MTTSLSVKKRTLIGRNACKKLRTSGEIPGIIYGEKKEIVPISFSKDSFLPYLRRREVVTKLDLDGKVENTLIKEIQYDALGDHIVHVDFHRISLDKKISISIALQFVGTPKGVHAGGVWDTQIREINVQCFPNHIPDPIVIDIEKLELGQKLCVKDIKIPDNVTLETDKEKIVVSVQAPRATATTSPLEEVRTEPERIVKEKPAKEEEA